MLKGLAGVLILIVVSAGPAYAIPLYYTFDVEVSPVPGGGLNPGFSVGDILSYTFLIDRDAQPAGYVDDAVADHFFAQLVSRDYGSGIEYVAPSGRGVDYVYGTDPTDGHGQLFSSSVKIFSYDQFVDWDLISGSTIFFLDSNVGEIGGPIAHGFVTNISISEVPLPSALLLFSSGLAGLLFRCRRKKPCSA